MKKTRQWRAAAAAEPDLPRSHGRKPFHNLLPKDNIEAFYEVLPKDLVPFRSGHHEAAPSRSVLISPRRRVTDSIDSMVQERA